MCHLVARGIYIRWQHLILLFIYIVQLYKEDWGILHMLGCRAVALPSTEQIVSILLHFDHIRKKCNVKMDLSCRFSQIYHATSCTLGKAFQV